MVIEAATIEELFARLDPLPSERVVVSALLERDGVSWTVTHASLLIGPPAMGRMGWGDWGRREGDHKVLLAPGGLPATFALRASGAMAVRDCVTVTAARGWLTNIGVSGTAASLGALPEAGAALAPPRAPLLARPGNKTPSASAVSGF